MLVHAIRRWATLQVLCVILIASCSSGEDVDEPSGPLPFIRYQGDEKARFEELVALDGWSRAEPQRNEQRLLEAVHAKTGLTFVLIPAGSFQMGSPDGEEGQWKWESSLHTVTVPAFMLCKTECTQAAWRRGGGMNRSFFKGADRPEGGVSWTQCHDWCARNGLRLPSESEWEFACRAGSTSRFCFGDDEGRLKDYAVYETCNDKGIESVGGRRPNSWGLVDMHGNVEEWCEDLLGSYSDAPTDGTARTTPGRFEDRILRGGHYTHPAKICRSGWRSWAFPASHGITMGFRPAADLPE